MPMCSGEEILMSIDTDRPSVADFRCETVTPDTVAPPCVHSRLADIPDSQAPGVGHTESRRDQPNVSVATSG